MLPSSFYIDVPLTAPHDCLGFKSTSKVKWVTQIFISLFHLFSSLHFPIASSIKLRHPFFYIVRKDLRRSVLGDILWINFLANSSFLFSLFCLIFIFKCFEGFLCFRSASVSFTPPTSVSSMNIVSLSGTYVTLLDFCNQCLHYAFLFCLWLS